MRGYNKVIIMGNLARDPDVRYTPAKQKVARITLAVGQVWKDKNTGEKKERVDFIPVTAWGNAADICEKYLKKGNAVHIEGRLSVRDFDDPKTGTRRWITEVVCEGITLLGGNKDAQGQQQGYNQPPAQSSRQSSRQSSGQSSEYGDFPMDIPDCGDDVDIPF